VDAKILIAALDAADTRLLHRQRRGYDVLRSVCSGPLSPTKFVISVVRLQEQSPVGMKRMLPHTSLHSLRLYVWLLVTSTSTTTDTEGVTYVAVLHRGTPHTTCTYLRRGSMGYTRTWALQ
jgi:hypothetical protein